MPEPDSTPDTRSEGQPAEPPVTVERVGSEAVVLRFSLNDDRLDLADEEEEQLGGEPACWAHLFEDDPEATDR
jgi:hypothetical protein